jgi:hypothetical protein
MRRAMVPSVETEGTFEPGNPPPVCSVANEITAPPPPGKWASTLPSLTDGLMPRPTLYG